MVFTKFGLNNQITLRVYRIIHTFLFVFSQLISIIQRCYLPPHEEEITLMVFLIFYCFLTFYCVRQLSNTNIHGRPTLSLKRAHNKEVVQIKKRKNALAHQRRRAKLFGSWFIKKGEGVKAQCLCIAPYTMSISWYNKSKCNKINLKK